MDADQFVAKWGKVNAVCDHLIENPNLGRHCTQGSDAFLPDGGPYPDLDPNCGDTWCDGKGWRKEVDWDEIDQLLEDRAAFIKAIHTVPPIEFEG